MFGNIKSFETKYVLVMHETVSWIYKAVGKLQELLNVVRKHTLHNMVYYLIFKTMISFHYTRSMKYKLMQNIESVSEKKN